MSIPMVNSLYTLMILSGDQLRESILLLTKIRFTFLEGCCSSRQKKMLVGDVAFFGYTSYAG